MQVLLCMPSALVGDMLQMSFDTRRFKLFDQYYQYLVALILYLVLKSLSKGQERALSVVWLLVPFMPS